MRSIVLSTLLSTSTLTTTAFITKPQTLRSLTNLPMTNAANTNPTTKQIAIIGAGAAGLTTARAFLSNEKSPVNFKVSVFESRHRLGGIWEYTGKDGEKKARPMYKHLRTNLPKEVMAFRDFPWVGPEESYVTHADVNKYLNDYSREFGLEKCISYGCTVEQLTVLDHGNGEEWPQISLQWSFDGKIRQRTFDSVCICNGHYALPSYPKLRGLDFFRGQVIHAIEYDDADEYCDKTVLCVGARASGMDIAREIGLVAKTVYLSDSTCDERQDFETNVVLMPKTQYIDDDGCVHFSTSDDTKQEEVVNDIDVIIFCSGYDYDFPFINKESNLDLNFHIGERRVSPLFAQLWHAKYPSISFIGIPHSVVPFPLFEIQANVVRKASQLQYTGQTGLLPPLSERLKESEQDAISGGPNNPGRIQDTHLLGSYQWDYCRRLAKMGGFYDESMENYIATNKELYDCAGRGRKAMIPGGEDVYRQTRFLRDDDNRTCHIRYDVPSTQPTATL